VFQLFSGSGNFCVLIVQVKAFLFIYVRNSNSNMLHNGVVSISYFMVVSN